MYILCRVVVDMDASSEAHLRSYCKIDDLSLSVSMRETLHPTGTHVLRECIIMFVGCTNHMQDT